MTEEFNKKIEDFIETLKNFDMDKMDNVFNPWKDYDENHDFDKYSPEIRCCNLCKYLTARKDATYILIAEAPGFQGCHFSGVPMTSERLILQDKYGLGKIGLNLQRTSKTNLTNVPKIVQDFGFCEPTATIVWNQIVDEIGIDSKDFVLWNAFPFHPYKYENNMLTNRKPKKKEILDTKIILSLFLELFDKKQRIICIGNVSKNTLGNILKVDFKLDKVRHPANGGANDFRNEIQNLIF